jgi:tetratricopeptide (TPR) repeat protein
MSEQALHRHPEAEALAAFVEGHLSDAEMTAMQAHLVDCQECREVAGAAAAFATAEGTRARRPPVWWWAAAAAVATAVVGLYWYAQTRDPLARLSSASAALSARPVVPRLSGQPWAPSRLVVRGGPAADSADLRLRATAAEIITENARRNDAGALHARGVAQLLSGNAAQAVADLEAAVAGKPEDRYWSDLAAARLVANDPNGALAAADEAIRDNPRLAAAHFNRALALEALGRHDEAPTSYQAAAEIEPGSPWASEAQARIRRLNR